MFGAQLPLKLVSVGEVALRENFSTDVAESIVIDAYARVVVAALELK